MAVGTLRSLSKEERHGSYIPDAFRVSRWESFLPPWIAETYYLVCKAAFFELRKEEQNQLLQSGHAPVTSNIAFQRRSIQRFLQHLPTQELPFDRLSSLALLQELNLIVQYDDGIWDVYLNPPFPDDVFDIDLYQRRQLFTLRYHQTYAPRLVEIRKGTRTNKGIYFHMEDLCLLLGVHRVTVMEQVLQKAVRERILDIESMDGQRVVLVFRDPKLEIPEMSDIEIQLIRTLEHPLMETSIIEIDRQCLGNRGEAETRMGLNSLQDKEMIVFDEPIDYLSGDQQFFLEITSA